MHRMAILLLEITVCDIPNMADLRGALHVVAQWYALSRQDGFTQADIDQLKAGGREVVAAMRAVFAETGVHDMQLPKIHRLSHVSESVTLFGNFNEQTTESSESKHRDFKKMIRW